ncbi:hypothetical protein WT02_13505 [Burkholderia stagnalis]|nr:hypothetical protein WT03_19145 [Burkholderia stagnalis]KVL97652.1 hypothetical protein WT02_13505 [Burkholderia stagnalis]KVM11708.1 hypothetical protein WT04_14495 [Burkholderia stagnalis]
MQMPRASLLTLGDGDVLKTLNPSKASAERIEVFLQAHFIHHVFSVGQRNHAIGTDRFASKAHLLFRTLCRIHEVLFGILGFSTLGAR